MKHQLEHFKKYKKVMTEIDTMVMHSNDPHLSLERRLYLLKQIVAMQTQLNQITKDIKESRNR